jgi:hypothetical protein
MLILKNQHIESVSVALLDAINQPLVVSLFGHASCLGILCEPDAFLRIDPLGLRKFALGHSFC